MDRNLRAFGAVVTTGNLTAAAARIGLTQPALTKTIRRLEREFGARLFMRTPRGMVLTEAGHRLPLRVQAIEMHYRQAEEEVHAIIRWLTGYDEPTLQRQIDEKVDFETFFARAPRINPDVSKITGVICGYRVEEIEDKLMQQIRYLDKLVDELARGKAMDKILRK